MSALCPGRSAMRGASAEPPKPPATSIPPRIPQLVGHAAASCRRRRAAVSRPRTGSPATCGSAGSTAPARRAHSFTPPSAQQGRHCVRAFRHVEALAPEGPQRLAPARALAGARHARGAQHAARGVQAVGLQRCTALAAGAGPGAGRRRRGKEREDEEQEGWSCHGGGDGTPSRSRPARRRGAIKKSASAALGARAFLPETFSATAARISAFRAGRVDLLALVDVDGSSHVAHRGWS